MLPKLNKKLIKEICKWIEGGNTFKDACTMSGISEAIFYIWKKQGLKDEREGNKGTLHFQLLESTRRSNIKFKAFHLNQIQQSAIAGSIEDSKWLLVKKFNEEFGKREKVEITSKLDDWKDAFDSIGKDED